LGGSGTALGLTSFMGSDIVVDGCSCIIVEVVIGGSCIIDVGLTSFMGSDIIGGSYFGGSYFGGSIILGCSDFIGGS